MSGSNKFFSEDEKNDLLNSILNADYDNEDKVWDLALELEHISIVLRTNILEYSDG